MIDSMLLVGHRGVGAGVVELDVQVGGAGVVVSHFVPVVGWVPGLRRDGWALRWGVGGVGLAEAVGAVPAGAEVLLDLKEDRGGRGEALVAAVLRSGVDPARCYASSKQWEVLGRLRAAGFRTWRTAGSRRAVRRLLASPPTPDHGVTVRHTLLDRESTRRLRRHCGLVVAWTVNSPARAVELAAYGVGGITSDSAAVFRAVSG